MIDKARQGKAKMQVTEVSNEGLSRSYKVVVSAEEIENRVNDRLQTIAKTAKIPGFRPGKVPLSVMKRQYGKAVLGEILEKAVDDGSKKAIDDNAVKPALQPKIEVTSFDEGADLEFSMDLEVLPEVPKVEFSSIALEKMTAKVDDGAVQLGLDRLKENAREYSELEEARPSENGDRVTLDFVGKLDGEVFEGGEADDFPLVLGSGSMIPGFEEQVVGLSVGDKKTIEVTFPENYQNDDLAGKSATFDLTINKIEGPRDVELNDDFAKGYGQDSLDALKDRIRQSLERDYAAMTRNRMKRALLDQLAEQVSFDVPAGMVDIEFDSIWKQLEEEMKRNGESFEEAGERSEEATREEYRAIAERRVRLGLVLSDIGNQNDIKVEQEELQKALLDQARRYPGQEKQVFDYFTNTPGAIEQLRAPIFEDKVVDFLFELVTVNEKDVTAEELLADPDEDEAATASESEAQDKAEG
jgi:trigger factor